MLHAQPLWMPVFLFASAFFSALTDSVPRDSTPNCEVSLLQRSTWRSPTKRHTPASLLEVVQRSGRRLTRRQMAKLKGQPEILEEYKPEGLAVKSQLSIDEQTRIAGSVTAESYEKELEDFVNHQGSRYINDADNQASGMYLEKAFRDLGYEVQVQSESFATEGNVVAFKKGSRQPKKWVLVGAHFDSVNWEDTKDEAPGAEDNGSGVAALLQTARALKDTPTDLSVAFVGFNGEEEGTLGSKGFVDELKREGGVFSNFGALQAALIMDEVAYPSKENHHDNQVILETSGKDKVENRALVETVAEGLSSESSISTPWVNYNGFGSDHMSFLEAGYPALLLIERDNMFYSDKYGHSKRDTLDHTDKGFGSAMTRLAIRGILKLANPTEKHM